MREWQPIETAPKDGKRILICDEFEIGTAFWYRDESRWAWSGGDYYKSEDSEPIQPSYWMPLPEPPIAAKGVSA